MIRSSLHSCVQGGYLRIIHPYKSGAGIQYKLGHIVQVFALSARTKKPESHFEAMFSIRLYLGILQNQKQLKRFLSHLGFLRSESTSV